MSKLMAISGLKNPPVPLGPLGETRLQKITPSQWFVGATIGVGLSFLLGRVTGYASGYAAGRRSRKK